MIERCSFYGGVEVGLHVVMVKRAVTLETDSLSETDNPSSKSVKLDGKTDG